MGQKECCVCHCAVGEDAPAIGTRSYCAEHYRRVGVDRKGLWRSTALAVVGLVVFVIAVNLVFRAGGVTVARAALLPLGIVLALVPAALWLVVFYVQDRLEPEPKAQVLTVFVLGALLAQAVGVPVVRDLFQVQAWLWRAPLVTQILGSILIVGFTQEFIKYAVVRYGIYRSPEFDERIDGVIYSAAAGLGLATLLNVHYVIEGWGAQLHIGALRIVVTTLAQASFSGLMGYFLGRAKFENMGPLWLPLGLLLAATLNGAVTLMLREVNASGLTFTPMNGLILAAAVAVVVFGVLFALIRRVNAATLAGI